MRAPPTSRPPSLFASTRRSKCLACVVFVFKLADEMFVMVYTPWMCYEVCVGFDDDMSW